MKGKMYSAAAHLIHSRLQLIRHRFHPRQCHLELFRIYYAEYLQKAAKSVKLDHGIEANGDDLTQAINLLLESLRCDGAEKYYVVVQRDYKSGAECEITTYDGGHFISPADPLSRYTHHQALAIANDIRSIHKHNLHVYVDIRWHLPLAGDPEQ